jgi:hypothetical protein
MENKPILGELLKGGEERDAIHIAILPVTAHTYIPAGAQIFIRPDLTAILSGKSNAVADPFLKEQIRPGEKFYALLNPYTIESLRHEWVHKDFPNQNSPAEIEKSLEWMKVYADEMGEDSWGGKMDVDTLLRGADDWIKDGDYLRWGFDTDYIEDEFWKHYEIIRGVVVPDNKREDFFSCSC